MFRLFPLTSVCTESYHFNDKSHLFVNINHFPASAILGCFISNLIAYFVLDKNERSRGRLVKTLTKLSQINLGFILVLLSPS